MVSPMYGYKSHVFDDHGQLSVQNPFTPYNSLTERIQAITSYIDEAAERDLYNFFVDLVYEIFGQGPTMGWALDNLKINKFDEYKYGESVTVYKFLCGNGYIFKLCYKLLPNSSIKFNLYFSDIPIGLRHKIENSFGHSYYGSRFVYHMDSNIPIGLSLNTFEYYMFHFALYGLKLTENDVSNFNNNLNESDVYKLLCLDYLHLFLPLENSASNILPILHFNVLSTNTNYKQFTSPSKSLSFIKKEISCIDKNDKVECSWIMKSEATWRSEIVAFFFIDIWLSFNNISLVPSIELNKLIRCLIKHFHIYSNRAKQQPTDSLKSILIPRHGMHIYHYLSYYMVNWPQDFSFRVLLEIWLCYIQPWRYEILDDQQFSITESEMNDKWRVFCIQNLLCYTKLFYLAIKRFNSVNICTPRYSIMIFRLLKAFTYPYLLKMLLDIEKTLIHKQQNTKLNALLSNYLVEAEGPFYKYKPMFSEEHTYEYTLFYTKLENAVDLINTKLQLFQEDKIDSSSMVEMIFTARKQKISDYSIIEWEEIQTNIQSSLLFMQQINNVTTVPLLVEPNLPSTWSISSLNSSHNISGISHKNNSFIQSFERNSTYLFSKETCNKQWEIDPDYLGTLSFENDTLVKLSIRLRNTVECHWKSQILKYSSEDTIWAGVLRQVLIRPPLMIFSYEPRDDGSGKRIRTPKIVEPTISFRWAASYYNLTWILFLLTLIFLFKNIGLCIILLYVFRVIYLCLKYLFGYAPPFIWDNLHKN